MGMTTEPDVDLEGLSDVEATIDFTNPKDFTRTLQALLYNASSCDPTSDHTVLVTGFPKKYISIDDDEQPLFPGSRKALYFEESESLIITMPGDPHEVAAMEFHNCLIKKIVEAGCFEEVISTGRARVSIGGVQKEPDASWGPFRALGSGPGYRTCVLEAATSESGRGLSRDAKIWLEHEESHVMQVIGVKVCRRRPEIIFKVWKRGRQQLDARASHPPRAVVDQEIIVSLENGRPVAEGTLFLSFERILERNPRPGTAEGDFKFSARELGGIARRVWSTMDFEID
ncbi:hypothetical protein VF21_05853 [Pseudogymnoascus sp. 05NY08]|nr:hypothetical protein VF21_05853 [Pseudogymnoascus sp. 05NY08]